MQSGLKKKLHKGPVIDVDPQVLRWRKRRRKLGLYKPSKPTKEVVKVEELPESDINLWDLFK